MSHIIEEEVDAPIRSKTSQAYRDGYDAIDWGPDEEPAPKKDEGYQLGEMDPKLKEGLDEIRAKITSYYTPPQPGWNGTFHVDTYEPQIGHECPLCETKTLIVLVDTGERIFECSDRRHSFDEL